MITTDLYYPAELPNPQRADHTSSAVSPFMRTEMARGRAVTRRIYTTVPVMAQFTWIFTNGEAALFENWFKYKISDGAAWFNIQRKTPLGLRMLVCRFASMYTGPNMWGVNHWTYSATLEVYERDLLEGDWSILPTFITRPDIFDLAMNRQWPEA